MEKYKANRNSVEENEVPEKTETEKKQESTEKAVDLAATVALDVYTGGAFSKVKNVASNIPVVGGAVNDTWNKAVGNVSKQVSKTPVGDVAKKLDDSGVTDLASKGYNAYSSMNAGGSGGADNLGGASNSMRSSASKGSNLNASSSSNNQNNSSSQNSVGANSSSKSNSSFLGEDNGFLTGNIMPGKMSKKILLVPVLAFAFLIIMIVVIACGEKDNLNMSLTNHTVFSNSSAGSVVCSSDEVAGMSIYVGDKRISSMESSLSDTGSQFVGNSEEGYDNFKNVTLPEFEEKLEELSEGVIILSFNVYDLDNFNLYMNDYKNLIDNHPMIDFYVMSFGPVNDSAASLYGVSNSLLIDYNIKIKDEFGDMYLDVYNYLGSTYTTLSDGITYDNATNQDIHSYVMDTIVATGEIVCSGGGIEHITAGDLLGGKKKILNQSIISKIGEDALNEWNTLLKNDVVDAGIGTGLAPAIAAYGLIQGALNRGFIIPYFHGGRDLGEYAAIQGDWGELKTMTTSGSTVQSVGADYPNGLDSLGFVNWAIRVGGCNSFGYKDSSGLLALGEEIDIFDSIPGDIAVKDGKALMILHNNGFTAVVAEAHETYGIIFSDYYHSTFNEYTVVSMSSFYSSNCY